MSEENKKYSAFISYKHGDLDTFVAENLHKAIETFKVPRNIKKQIGNKKVERVFRDKDELPISSNLADNITQALQNSEYLIVICSPRTPESYWVQKEIETFIGMHGREHVLAVLIEGEPQESFPEMLQFEERETKAEDGSVTMERVPIEPLAADLRAGSRSGVKKLMKTEILRIMAPLLGCSYDDLRQRHRERRMRRVIGVSIGVSACFVAFGIYSAYNTMKINQQYVIKQMNQSRYLAETSQRILSEGDRELAIRIALEALPEYEGADDRPYVPEAEYALSEALGVYSSGQYYEAERKLTTDGNIEEMVVSWDQSLFAARDSMQNIYIWNAETYELQVQIEPEYGENYSRIRWNNINFNSENQLLCVSSNYICCQDSQNGSLIWEMEQYISDNAISRDKSLLFISDNKECWILDSLTGEVLATANEYADCSKTVFSPDNHYVAFSTTLEENPAFVVWDLETGAMTLISNEDWEGFYSLNIVFAGKKNIIATTSRILNNSLWDVVGSIKMYDVETQEIVWENDRHAYDMQVYYEDDDTEFQNPIVIYNLGEELFLLNKDTGEAISSSAMDGIVCARPLSTTTCFVADREGNVGGLYMDKDTYIVLGKLASKHLIHDCALIHGNVLHWSLSDNTITVSTRQAGPSYLSYAEDRYQTYNSVCTSDGRYILLQTLDQLLVLSSEDGTLRAELPVSRKDERRYCLYQDTNLLIYLDEDGGLHRYDLDAQQELACIQIKEEGDFINSLRFSQNGNWLAVSMRGSIKVYSIADFSPYATLEEVDLSEIVISNDGTYLAGRERDGTLGIYEVNSSKRIELEETGFGVMRGFYSEEVNLTVAHDHSWVAVSGTDQLVHVIDMATGHTLNQIEVASADRPFLEFTLDDSMLMIASVDNSITIYDLTADIISKRIMLEDNEIKDVTYLPERELCVLRNNGEAYLLTMKDNAYSVVACVPNFVVMDEISGKIFANNTLNGFGCFQYQSLDDLITQGNEVVNYEGLTELEKKTYYVD